MSTENSNSPDVAAQLLPLVLELAKVGGELAAERRTGVITVADTKSSAVDVVTAVDREVEELLRSRIAAARPDDSILGEEGDDVVGTSGLTWVIDPIDGTVNYLYGVPFWAVSVAVCAGAPNADDWKLLAGAVVAPTLGSQWHASAGGGAFKDGKRIAINSSDNLGVALLATGFGYRAEQRAEQAEILRGVLPQVRDIRRMGSAAIDLCMVADGTLDGYFESGVNPWDMAAGELVIRESGGVVTGLGGQAASPRMVVAGNPAIAPQIARIVNDAASAGERGV